MMNKNINIKKQGAVLGFPISHSLSPQIHQYWLDKYNIDGNYKAIEVAPENLASQINFMKKNTFYGANITIPLKEKIIDLCDEVSDTAQKIGAVNTISFQENKVIGDNTDAQGFISDCKKQSKINSFQNKTILLIGAGGASRAIIYALLEERVAKIIIVNRTVARAQELAQFFNKIYPTKFEILLELKQITESIDLIVNSSSQGMNGANDIEIDLAKFSQPIIYDIIYKPLETKLIQDAKKLNLVAINGLGMLLFQAAYAFEIWFGIFPEIDTILIDKITETLK